MDNITPLRPRHDLNDAVNELTSAIARLKLAMKTGNWIEEASAWDAVDAWWKRLHELKDGQP